MKNNRLLFIMVIVLYLFFFLEFFYKEENSQDVTTTIQNNYNVTGFSTDFTKVIEDVECSVVTIECGNEISSGFVYRFQESVATIISTYHGVNSDDPIHVYFDNGACFDGTLSHYDIFGDIAMIEVELPYEVKTCKMGDSSLLKKGEFVISIGTPLTLDFKGSVELGMVSNNLVSIDNSILFNNEKYDYVATYIQLSSDLKNGYSGAPVFNMSAEVIGVVTMSYQEDVCFALPINEVSLIVNNASNQDYSKIQYGIEGCFIKDMANYEKSYYNVPIEVISGMCIVSLKENEFGYISGLRTGDILLRINDITIDSYDDYLLASYTKADSYAFVVLRNGEEITLNGYIHD